MRWVALLFCTFGLTVVVLSAAASQDLPPGKGQEIVLRMCSNCHELDAITTSKMSKKRWTSLVDDMVSKGAEGTDAEVEIVIGYLSRNFGQPVNINTSTAKQIEAGLSFTAAESELLVKYRTEKGPLKTFADLLKVPGLNAALLDEQKKNILF